MTNLEPLPGTWRLENLEFTKVAQQTLQLLTRLDPAAAPRELVFLGLGGAIVRVPLDQADGPRQEQRPEQRYPHPSNLWRAAWDDDRRQGLLGPRSAWDCRHATHSGTPAPRITVWVLGPCLHVAALDAIEDVIVVKPGDDVSASVERLEALDAGAVGPGTRHLVVRTYPRMRVALDLSRPVDQCRELVNELEDRGSRLCSVLWRPSPATALTHELQALVDEVRQRVDQLTLTDHQRGLENPKTLAECCDSQLRAYMPDDTVIAENVWPITGGFCAPATPPLNAPAPGTKAVRSSTGRR